MRKFLFIIFLICLITTVFSQEKVIIKEYHYQASEHDSKFSSRKKALMEVKSIALEEFGTYIQSITDYSMKENNSSYSEHFQNNIKSISAGIIQTKILDEKWNGEIFYIKVSIKLDQNAVLDKINEYKKLNTDNIVTKNTNSLKWHKLIKHSNITPHSGYGAIKIGMSESDVVKLLGIPHNDDGRITGANGELFYYALMYKYENIFLGIYTNRDTRKVRSIRLYDTDFNKNGNIPSINGISIGSTKEELVNSFGEPKFKQKHQSCPSDENMNNGAITYSYEGINFWVCDCNNLIYLIDIP